MLDILEKVNLTDLPDSINGQVIEVSSEVGKSLTIRIMMSFAKAMIPIYLLSENLLSCIYELQEHLNSAEKREYIISQLTKDELFSRMTDSRKKLELMNNKIS